jgi:hypothetical protein
MTEETDHFEWIIYRGKRVLTLSFVPATATGTQGFQTLQRLVQELAAREPGSVLFLADFRKAGFNAGLALEWEKHVGLLNSQCRKIAGVEAGGVVLVTARAVLGVAQAVGVGLAAKTRFFPEPAQAMDWLTE